MAKRLQLCFFVEADKLDDEISDAATIADAVIFACDDFLRWYKIGADLNSITHKKLGEKVKPQALRQILFLRGNPLDEIPRATFRKRLDQARKEMEDLEKEVDARARKQPEAPK